LHNSNPHSFPTRRSSDLDDTDNPMSRSLEYLAVKTLRAGYQGRVSASHCGALAAYNEVHAHKVMDLLKEANISISSNPHISLVVQGRYFFFKHKTAYELFIQQKSPL